jgi:hypothetical protein
MADRSSTRIIDLSEWRATHGLTAYVERRSDTRAHTLPGWRSGVGRHLCRRRQKRPASVEPDRADRRSSERPYGVPFYGVYAGLPPD